MEVELRSKTLNSFEANVSIILDKLSVYNLEENIDEIVQNIYHDGKYRVGLPNTVGDWSVNDVVDWCRQLEFLGADMQKVTDKLRSECVDGYGLLSLTEKDWVTSLQLDYAYYYLIRIIIQGWKFGSHECLYLQKDAIRPLGNAFQYVTPNHNNLLTIALFTLQVYCLVL